MKESSAIDGFGDPLSTGTRNGVDSVISAVLVLQSGPTPYLLTDV